MDRVQGDRSSIGWREKRARTRGRCAIFAIAPHRIGLARMVPSATDHPPVPAIDAIRKWVTEFRGPVGLGVGHALDPILGRSLARRHQRALSPAFVEETQAGHFLQKKCPSCLARSILRLCQ